MPHQRIAVIATIGLMAAFTACSDGGLTGPPTSESNSRLGLMPDPSTSNTIRHAQSAANGVTVGIPNAPAQLEPGQSVQLTASVINPAGRAVPAQVGWSTSDPWVAAISSTGLLLALAPGTTTIEATFGHARDAFELVVAGMPDLSLEELRVPATVPRGTTFQVDGRVVNIGTGDAPPVLTRLRMLDAVTGETLFTMLNPQPRLSPGLGFSLTVGMRAQQDWPQHVVVELTTDVADVVAESDETNNTRSVALEITAP